jgi:hypothetical protein
LGDISAAGTKGARRNKARRRCGGGAAAQSPGESRERRGTGERGGKGGDRSKPTEPLVRLDQLAWRRRVGQAWQ